MRYLTLFFFCLLVCVVLAQPRFQIQFAQLREQSVVGGNPIEIRVNLTSPASSAGQIPVTSNRPDLCQAVPVQIQPGQSQVTLILPTRAVEQAASIIISVGEYGTVRDLQVQLQPEAPPVTQIQMQARVIGGDTSTALIVLERPATRPFSLSLQASPNLKIEPGLKVPAGVRQFEMPFSTTAVRQATSASLTWTGSRQVVGQTQLLPPIEIASLQCTPASIEGGQACQVNVSLSAPAPTTAKIRIFAPAHLRVPTETTISEATSATSFRLTSAPTREPGSASIEASTPAGRKSTRLQLEPTSSLYAADAASYYLMARAKDGWLEVQEAGQKWRAKPMGPVKLGELQPFGYAATVPVQAQLESSPTTQALTLQLQLAGSKTNWNVTEVRLLHP